jgi:hypothetical protein
LFAFAGPRRFRTTTIMGARGGHVEFEVTERSGPKRCRKRRLEP